MTEDEFDAWGDRLEEKARDYLRYKDYPWYTQEERKEVVDGMSEYTRVIAEMYERVMMGGGEEWEREFIGVDLDDEDEDLTL